MAYESQGRAFTECSTAVAFMAMEFVWLLQMQS